VKNFLLGLAAGYAGQKTGLFNKGAKALGLGANKNVKYTEADHYRLITQSLKAFPNSEKQKEIIKELNKVRKYLGYETIKK